MPIRTPDALPAAAQLESENTTGFSGVIIAPDGAALIESLLPAIVFGAIDEGARCSLDVKVFCLVNRDLCLHSHMFMVGRLLIVSIATRPPPRERASRFKRVRASCR